MSGPVDGVGRITIPYTVSGQSHECRMFVADPTLAGSDWVVDLHPDIGGTAVWTNAAQGLADAISYMLPTGTTVGSALLEEYSATGWLPRDTTSVTLTNLSGSIAPAAEITLTLRALDFTRPKIVLLDVNNPGPLAFTSPTAGGANVDGFIDPFLGDSVISGRPWAFMTTMHGIFLLVDSFVRSTITYNKQLAKRRGLK